MILHQGHQGSVTQLGTDLLVRGVSFAANGSVIFPRARINDWWRDYEKPVSSILTANAGVTVAGGYVTDWADQSGSGCDANVPPAYAGTITQTTGWSDGTLCLQFNDGCMLQNQLLPYTQGRTAKSAVYLLRHGDITLRGYHARSNGTLAHVFYQMGQDLAIDAQRTYPVFDIVTTRDQLVVFSEAPGAGQSRIYIDGRYYTLPLDAMPNPVADWNRCGLGCAFNGAGTFYFPQNWRLKQTAWINDATSSLDYRKLASLLIGREMANVIFIGNSITQGGYGGGGSDWVTPTSAVLGVGKGNCITYNGGEGGITTPQMIPQIAAKVVAQTRNASRNVLVVWEVANDIDSNHPCTNVTDIAPSARIVVDNLWNYVAQAKAQCAAAGNPVEVVVVTPILRAPAYYTANQSACCRMAADLMRAEFAERGVIRCISMDRVAPLMEPTPTWFFFDGVHPNAYGCRLIAERMISELSDLLESTQP